MNEILQKIVSKENARKAAEVALDLAFSDKTDEEKINALTDFLVSNAETLDDATELIPGWGPIIHGIVDSAPVDAVQAQLCRALAESLVQAIKGLRGLTIPQ